MTKRNKTGYIGDWFKGQKEAAREIPMRHLLYLTTACVLGSASMGYLLYLTWISGAIDKSWLGYFPLAYYGLVTLLCVLVLAGCSIGWFGRDKRHGVAGTGAPEVSMMTLASK